MDSPKFVAYYRVSTDKQKETGLGLKAQQEMVYQYAASVNGTIIAWYQETMSGNKIDRPMLKAALAHAKRTKAKLLIAKLDRLARNTHFVTGIMESGVEFVASDFPTADRWMLQMLAVFAEYERAQASSRTKQALAALKAQGKPLGAAAVYAANKSNNPASLQLAKRSREYTEQMGMKIRGMDVAGVGTDTEIAAALNRAGEKSYHGRQFDNQIVGKIRLRYQKSLSRDTIIS